MVTVVKATAEGATRPTSAVVITQRRRRAEERRAMAVVIIYFVELAIEYSRRSSCLSIR